MEPSAFEPIDPARASALLDRTKQRSAQLRRRRLLLLFGSAGTHGRAATALLSGRGTPRRFSPSTMAFGTVGVVVAIVIALVAVALTSGGTGGGQQVHSSPLGGGPAPSPVLAEVTGVTPAVANAVGLPPTSTVAPPTVKTGQPPLTIGGRPGAVFIGGEFCPYCAAERWAIIMAFSRFGTFSGLSEMGAALLK